MAGNPEAPIKQAKPRRQEREWRRRRHEILEAAARLFMDHGYAGATMQMIAEEAEYSVGYLYKHFSGKEDLLDEIIDSQMAAFETARREIRQACADRPLEALRLELVRISRQLQEQGQLVPLFLSYEVSCPERIRPRLLRYRREDADLFRAAVEKGEIRPCDPELAAATFDGVTWGLLRLLSETGRMDRLTEIPRIVEELLLGPLTKNAAENDRKDH